MTRLIQNQSSTIVRERDRRRLRAMAAMLCLGCILVGAVLGYVWLQVQRVRVSYGIESLRASRTRLEEQNRKLQLEVASLRAFARVDSGRGAWASRHPARIRSGSPGSTSPRTGAARACRSGRRPPTTSRRLDDPERFMSARPARRRGRPPGSDRPLAGHGDMAVTAGARPDGRVSRSNRASPAAAPALVRRP